MLIEKHEIKEQSATSESVVDALVQIHKSVDELGRHSGGGKASAGTDGEDGGQNQDSLFKLPPGCEFYLSSFLGLQSYYFRKIPGALIG